MLPFVVVEHADPGADAPADVARAKRLLAWIVLAGAAWRYGFVIVARRNTPVGLNDSLYYSSQAWQLAHGRWFTDVLGGAPAAEHGPLAAVALAPVSRFGDPVLWQRLGNATYGSVTVAIIAVLAWRVAGPRAATVAGAIAAALPTLWLNDFVVMSEAVALLCVTAALWAVLLAIRTPSWQRQALAGLLLGLAALARSELVLLAALLAVIVARLAAGPWRRRVGAGAVVLAATLATLAPWLVFNLARFDRPVLLTTNDGTTLLGANCDEVYSGPYIGGWSLFCVLDGPQPETGDDSVRAALQRREGLTYALEHAGRLPIVVPARIARSFDLWGLDNLVHQDVGEERPAWAAWTGVVTWWLMMPLAAVGLWRLARPERLLLGAPLLTVVIVSALYYGAHRIRAPAEPAAVVLAAVALTRRPRWWRVPLVSSPAVGERLDD